MIHALKTETEFFKAVASGEKPFEIRKIDRPYAVGDYLALNEWDGSNYTGRCALVSVSYILVDPRFCKDGICTMGIVPCRIGDAAESFRMMSDRQFREVPVYERRLGDGHERH